MILINRSWSHNTALFNSRLDNIEVLSRKTFTFDKFEKDFSKSYDIAVIDSKNRIYIAEQNPDKYEIKIKDISGKHLETIRKKGSVNFFV